MCACIFVSVSFAFTLFHNALWVWLCLPEGLGICLTRLFGWLHENNLALLCGHEVDWSVVVVVSMPKGDQMVSPRNESWLCAYFHFHMPKW